MQPRDLFIVLFAGWINRSQQDVIDYLRTENRILKEAFGPRRILLTDNQRRRLAIKAQSLGRATLWKLGTVFSPDVILRWYRDLVEATRQESNPQPKRTGRPPTSPELIELILRMARENRGWGYVRIQGALKNLGYRYSETTIARILRRHGIEPAPDRKRKVSWKEFIKINWNTIGAIDFTTVDVWTKGGLVPIYLLFAIELKSRRVHFAGCSANVPEVWMKQIARNLTDCDDGFFLGTQYVIMDRDSKFSEAFRSVLAGGNVTPVRLPARSPNLNAFMERFFHSLKSECLDRMVFLGETSLRAAVQEFVEHYHRERNHQGIGNCLIDPDVHVGRPVGEIRCRERIGGLLKYYYRDAA